MSAKYFFTFLALAVFSVKSLAAQNQINIIPQPTSIERQKGEFIINQNTVIYTATKDSDLMNVARKLNDILKLHLGYALKLGDMVDYKGGILLVIDPSIANREGYKMVVSTKSIEIRGASAADLFYGVQSLRQFLPAKEALSAVIPCMKIADEPRFKWRGMHLDVGRHFFNKEEVMKYIDYLARYN